MPSPDAYWIALRQVRGVGPRVYRLLLEKFLVPEKVFAATVAEIAALGVPRSTAENIVEFRDFDPAEKELCELPRIGAHLVKWSDPEYSPSLRQIADPPPYLFVHGSAPLASLNCIAIVGARAASDAGRRMAQRLGVVLPRNQATSWGCSPRN
jgi:DNA processing protein